MAAQETIRLRPGAIELHQLRRILREGAGVALAKKAKAQVEAGHRAVMKIVDEGQTVYGVNTGFGKLASVIVPKDQLAELQRNLVMSHSVGVGPPLEDGIVRLVLALKAASLARGHSGVSWAVVETLLAFLERDLLPCLPSKGSVGASGDLAPLAHLSAVLIGEGEAKLGGETMPGAAALDKAGLKPLVLGPKEGLALLNGTQVSAALALAGLFEAEDLLNAGILAGALSLDAAMGSTTPFDPRIQAVRGQPGQAEVAKVYRDLLEGSAIRESHIDCDRVQDPYSLRCQPQVMGACLDHIRFAAQVFAREANAVSDNPLVFPAEGDVLPGGNFHAEPVAMAADVLALAIAEIGALAERRVALLIDTNFSALPPFLIEEGGVNSGFMMAHVTAAALASENKSLAHPASVDSLPTSANQEDHVSKSTFAARRLSDMAANTAGILGIELLAAAQGIEFHAPTQSSKPMMALLGEIRKRVPRLEHDRFMAPDMAAITALVTSGRLNDFVPAGLVPSLPAG